MGGKNHQPCNAYLETSTRMSRAASLVYIAFEQANVCLEDLILAELNGSRGSVEGVLSSLDTSKGGLSDLRQEISNLRAEMEEKGYSDLPSLATIDLEELGRRLRADGMVEEDAWEVISEKMKAVGFYGVLDFFHDHASGLLHLTNLLARGIRNLRASVEEGSVSSVLEENRSGNVKREFARLYASWKRFDCLFLASSVLSTELWYAFNQFGSLVEGESVPASVS